MRIGNTARGWGPVARVLHWLTAALIAFQAGLGLWMTGETDALMAKFENYQLHKSVGSLILAVVLLRLAWRAGTATPDPPAGAPRWVVRGAAAGHATLYALMIAMPISGWLMVSASPLQEQMNISNSVFGLFALPDPFVPGDPKLEAVFKTAHAVFGWLLAAVVGGHVGAALWHHFWRRDGVLRRMIGGPPAR